MWADKLWLRLMVIIGLTVLASFCFLEFLTCAFAYSANETQLAYWRAWLFLSVFAGLEIFSAAILGLSWEPSIFHSAGLRFAARYGSALALCLIGTSAVVGILIGFSRW
jgi:hypothetical protein